MDSAKWPNSCSLFTPATLPFKRYQLQALSAVRLTATTAVDNLYIPGAVIPEYIIIKPDFPECIDDYGFLWFEDEAVVAGSASWVVAGNAADAIVKESK